MNYHCHDIFYTHKKKMSIELFSIARKLVNKRLDFNVKIIYSASEVQG